MIINTWLLIIYVYIYITTSLTPICTINCINIWLGIINSFMSKTYASDCHKLLINLLLNYLMIYYVIWPFFFHPNYIVNLWVIMIIILWHIFVTFSSSIFVIKMGKMLMKDGRKIHNFRHDIFDSQMMKK